MKIKLIKSIVIWLSIIALPILANEKSVEIDKFIQGWHDIREFNGNVLVSKNGKVILEKSYGYANFEWDIKNTPETKFRIASVTKQFTAMLIMQMVQEGKISLDAPITKYLPNYRKDTGDKVTIHQLLNHTSGIPDYLRLAKFRKIDTKNPYSMDEFVQYLCSDDLDFDPGTQWRYSNSGYMILGNVIAKVSGKTYWQVLDDKILRPLEMKNTGYDSTTPLLKNRASGYGKTLENYVNADYYDMSIPYASGSMYSTTKDLMLWDAALYTEKLLKKDLIAKMYEPSTARNYGYGWFNEELPEKYGKNLHWVSHAGGIKGFNSYISRIIEDKYLIVFLNNTGGASIRPMTQGIIKILYNKPYKPAKPRIFSTLYDVIKEKGIEAGLEDYHQLTKQGLKLREGDINYFGYELIKVGLIDAAIAFFKLNVEKHPNSSNVYDSLGEAYVVNNEPKLALACFEKALVLDPKKINAQEAIKKLKAIISY